MRPTHDTLLGVLWQGVVRLASALWWPVRIFGVVVGGFRGVAPPRPRRRSGGSWRTQAG